ncbi:MAG: hypothetical protein ND895_26200 [Pyrinomonadaceae bacterium]|nr:hypothetical protein [Pyrinomonadaceae bacterium]
MIIVFADDQTVDVLADIASVRRECEAVDVEDGVYRFFDELGRRLVPRFIAPVERGPIIIGVFTSIGSGSFELELDPQDDGSSFETSLANVVAIEPNGRFTTIPDLASHVAEKRRLLSKL